MKNVTLEEVKREAHTRWGGAIVELIDILMRDCYTDLENVLEYLETHYYGYYHSKQDFIDDFFENIGFFKKCDRRLKQYFNYEAYLKDLEFSGEVFFIVIEYDRIHVLYDISSAVDDEEESRMKIEYKPYSNYKRLTRGEQKNES